MIVMHDPPLKRALKRIRQSQPFNYLATSTMRALLDTAGVRSDAVARMLSRVGPVRRALPNGRPLRLWSRGDDGVSNAVYWYGWDGYEPESTPLFFRLAAQAAVTLDIGANVGYHALLAGHANPAGRVYAFEPVPLALERLRHHIALNCLHNVECVPAAVGASDGKTSFFVGEAGIPVGASLSEEFVERVRREAPVRLAEQVQALRVPVLTIDRFVAERQIERVDLVKLDIEGAEPQALQGMRALLRRDRPAILCEVLADGQTVQALEAALRPFGYRYYHLTAAGPIARERLQGYDYGSSHNYLFTTKEVIS
jgi:FkbM family methyltransferase